MPEILFDPEHALQMQNKIYLFSTLVDYQVLSDISEVYQPSSWSKTFVDCHNKNYKKLSYLSYIQVGEAHTTVGNSQLQLFTWGWNDCGQLGIDLSPDEPATQQGTGSNNAQSAGSTWNKVRTSSITENIVMFTSGSNHAVLLDEMGDIYGWGSNEKG